MKGIRHFRRASAGLAMLAFLGSGGALSAHIGSPNVILEEKAGPFLVRVNVRPPEVVPGLAEISIRVLEGRVDEVTVAPIHSSTGREGAPPPDVARPVRGGESLYSAELWFMETGAYNVDVNLSGPEGRGAVSVPVNSVATTRRDMPPALGGILTVLGVLLFGLAVTVVHAAVGQSVLASGERASAGRKWRAHLLATGAVLLFGLGLYGGRAWWNAVDRDYRNKRLFEAVQADATVRVEKGQRIIVIGVELSDRNERHWKPLAPDHGKLMHLFLLGRPDGGIFAHVHPIRKDWLTFEVPAPPFPAGEYLIYADLTHEDGFSHTLTAEVALPPPTATERKFELLLNADPGDPMCAWPVEALGGSLYLLPDADDSWHLEEWMQQVPGASSPRTTRKCITRGGYAIELESAEPWVAGRESSLSFQVTQPGGEPAPLAPYMGMMAHAAVRRTDGSVFAHLHPVGTISMASQEVFLRRESGDPLTEAGFQREPADHSEHLQAFAAEGHPSSVSFPYQFPRSGDYRLWVQVRTKIGVLTGVFDILVEEPVP